MTDSKTNDCAVFRDSVFDFQADELPESDRLRVQEHLNGCELCQRRLEIEESFLKALRVRLSGPPAPTALKNRIREGLAGTAVPRRGRLLGWLFRPEMAGMAAALMLVAVLGFSLGPSGGISQATDVVKVSRVGTIVDIDCDKAGYTPEEQRRCKSMQHVNALKVSDDEYWRFDSGQAEGRNLMLDPERRGERVVATGEYYTGLATIRLIDIKPTDPVGI